MVTEPTGDPRPDLMTDLKYLERLDELRNRAWELRDQGLRSLVHYPNNDEAWDAMSTLITRTLVFRSRQLAHSLGKPIKVRDFPLPKVELTHPNPNRRANAALLPQNLAENKRFNLGTQAEYDVPVFFAATYMRSELDYERDHLPKDFWLCLYWVVRELYASQSPDWPPGGARADGRSGAASVFVTEECARALGYLTTTLEVTAKFLDEVREIGAHVAVVRRNGENRLHQKWCRHELAREERSLQSIIEVYAGKVLIGITKDDWGVPWELLLPRLGSFLLTFLYATERGLQCAVADIERHWIDEGGGDDESLQGILTKSAHSHALQALKRTKKRFAEVTSCEEPKKVCVRWMNVYSTSDFGPNSEWANALKRSADGLRTTRLAVLGILEPVHRYLEGELQSALFDVRTQKSTKGVRDVALAASAVGLMAPDGDWSRSVYREAVETLVDHLSDEGSLPAATPFYQAKSGLELSLVNAHALRAMAQLLQHRPGPLDETVVERMVRYFSRWQADFEPVGDKPAIGWKRPGVSQQGSPSRWVTSISVNALDRIKRMLDQKINERLANHFTVEEPGSLRGIPRIRELMCTDVGIASAPWDALNTPRPLLTHEIEQLRAHLVGHPLRGGRDTLTSVILYGPPGTGKTTILESLAVTSHVPLVRVSPTDFLIRGAEAVERRGHAVMKALSMASQMVILFDEFDPILARRASGDEPPANVLAFLTGSMLPRLSHLNRAAKRNRFVYALATNYVERLDAAAIRKGRFDHKRGVYPPDAVSRLCRVVGQLAIWEASWVPEDDDDDKSRPEAEKVPWNESWFLKRLAELVSETASVPIVILVKPGWFLAARQQRRKKMPDESAWAYLLNEDKDEEPPDWPLPGDLRLPRPPGVGADMKKRFPTLVALDQTTELHLVYEGNKQATELAEQTFTAGKKGWAKFSEHLGLAEEPNEAMRAWEKRRKILGKRRLQEAIDRHIRADLND